ncbi:uncharacterized protein EI97DRAFT_386970, partial [Westerdykella ornata]
LMGETAEVGSRRFLRALVAGIHSHAQYLNNCETDRRDGVSLWVRGERGQSSQKRV